MRKPPYQSEAVALIPGPMTLIIKSQSMFSRLKGLIISVKWNVRKPSLSVDDIK